MTTTTDVGVLVVQIHSAFSSKDRLGSVERKHSAGWSSRAKPTRMSPSLAFLDGVYLVSRLPLGRCNLCLS
jgi:hypothetical protein